MLNTFSLRQNNIRGKKVPEVIQSLTGTGSSNYFVFSNIPQTYKDLRIIVHGQGTGTGGYNSVALTANGIALAGYYFRERTYTLSTTIAGQQGVGTEPFLFVGALTSVGTDGGMYGAVDILISDYSNPLAYTPVLVKTGSMSSPVSGGIATDLIAGWIILATISSIQIGLAAGGNWTTSSTATLYGIPG